MIIFITAIITLFRVSHNTSMYIAIYSAIIHYAEKGYYIYTLVPHWYNYITLQINIYL